jgi:uncharacterized membrane protein HdeD (DUF308 family)
MPRRSASSSTAASENPPAATVTGALRRIWWIPLLRGLALIVLGLLLMVEPLEVLRTLVVVFAVFLLVDGVVAVLQGLANRDQQGWRWWLVQGVVDVVFAVIIVAWPSVTALALFYLLVVWALVLGIAAIIGAAALLRNRDLAWPWLLTVGLLSTLFGLLLITKPQTAGGVLSVTVTVFGIYAFASGAIHVVSAFSVRSVAQYIDKALEGESPVLDAIVERRAQTARVADARAEDKQTVRDDKAAVREEAQRVTGGVIVLDDPDDVRPASSAPAVGSADAQGAQPRLGEERVADEGDDVEDRVRHDQRHDAPPPPA